MIVSIKFLGENKTNPNFADRREAFEDLIVGIAKDKEAIQKTLFGDPMLN